MCVTLIPTGGSQFLHRLQVPTDACLVAPEVMLRPVEEADLDFMAQIYGADSGPFIALASPSPDRLRERWMRDQHQGSRDGKLIVILDGQAVGLVSWTAQHYFSTEQSLCWNIGIVLASEYRGRGLGSAAQRALAKHLFETTDVNRIEAGTDIDNIAERRALAAAGFILEGVLRGAQFRDGIWHDMALYSRTRPDHDAAKT
jgi:RimJ/RimL family protein N-acetyltransferase